jgi:hypothetical protein
VAFLQRRKGLDHSRHGVVQTKGAH